MGKLFRDILKVGALACISPLETVLTVRVVTRLVSAFGTEALAGYRKGARLEFLLGRRRCGRYLRSSVRRWRRMGWQPQLLFILRVGNPRMVLRRGSKTAPLRLEVANGAHSVSDLGVSDLAIGPTPDDPRLSQTVEGIDQTGAQVETVVVTERPLTLYLNAREIVTMMTIGDHPDLLAVGYLLNQNMLRTDDEITAIDYEDDIETIVVRTARKTDYEDKLRKKTQTSGCAQGTVFGDLMEEFASVKLNPRARLKTSDLYALTRKINTEPSLYLKAGAIHGCVLCKGDKPLLYMEDVGRHNAVDKIAGYMFLNGVNASDKTFYTTGRLTSEMVIKTVKMGIPILVSRSGFTAWGVDLANTAGLTLIGRARGKRFVCVAGAQRLVFDSDLATVDVGEGKMRKGAQSADAD